MEYKMEYRKKILSLAAALAVGLCCLLSGCGEQPDGDDAPPGDHVKVSDNYFGLGYYQNGPICPVTDNTEINRLLCEALYEGLFEVGNNFTAVPVLCEDYQTDGTEFTFTIRNDVTFWSGEKLTAEDVVASLQTAMYNEDSPYHNRLVEVGSIRAAGNYEVEITLTSPNITFPRLLDIPIFRDGTAGEDFADGTGPFQPVKEGGTWSLVANENWHGGYLGSIRTISLVPIVRPDAAVSSFQTGDISLVREPRISTDPAAVSGTVDTIQVPTADLHYLGLNYENSQLANKKVRQALSAAIDRASLCETELQSFADPAVLPVNPQPADVELDMSEDASKVSRLLAEANGDADADSNSDEDSDSDSDSDSDPDSDSDSDSDADSGSGSQPETGEPISLVFLVNSDNAFKTAAAEKIAALWQAAGITVTIEKQPYETFKSMIQNGNFDVYYGETLLTPDFDLRPLLSAAGGLNYGGYSNETMSNAVAAARRGEDVTKLYRLFLDEMPIIPIAFERNRVILRQGLVDAITPAPYNAFAGVEHWTSEGT